MRKECHEAQTLRTLSMYFYAKSVFSISGVSFARLLKTSKSSLYIYFIPLCGKQYNTIAGKNYIHCISIDILSEFYVKINIFWVDSEWKISTLHDESIII